ncbi:MAG: chromosomal replication initiator protein DnaA [Solirubrobacterales bacterium]
MEEDVPRPTPDAAHDLAATWRQAQEELRASVSDSTYQLWFEQLRPVSRRGPIIFLTGPRHVLRWVGKRYPELVRAALRKGGSGLREFELVTSEHAHGQSKPQGTAEVAARVALNPAYTFERFVIGPGNQFAHAAALAIAEAPGEAYNPLFLHGPPGLGKTHLLGAIANYLHFHNPQLTIHYTTAECFTNEFVSSLQGTGIEEFKRRYRRANVLLIDDVQFLQGKARTADEFFHTFNALYEAGAQLVLTADRLPGELSALAARLRDRFEWGLTVALEPPDLPTRLVFLANLTRERSEQVAPEALRAIASRAISNLRLLEGALTRILALGSLTSSAITPETVDRALPGAATGALVAKPEVAQIQQTVATRLEIPVERLLSPSRVAPIARARQLAMYLTRELTDLSLPEIAAAFNRRDHTTVIHAIRKVEARAVEDAALARTIEQLTSDLAAPGIDRDRTD